MVFCFTCAIMPLTLFWGIWGACDVIETAKLQIDTSMRMQCLNLTHVVDKVVRHKYMHICKPNIPIYATTRVYLGNGCPRISKVGEWDCWCVNGRVCNSMVFVSMMRKENKEKIKKVDVCYTSARYMFTTSYPWSHGDEGVGWLNAYFHGWTMGEC